MPWQTSARSDIAGWPSPKGKADLLLKLADESDRGILRTSEWLSARLSLQEERLQDAKVRFGSGPLN